MSIRKCTSFRLSSAFAAALVLANLDNHLNAQERPKSTIEGSWKAEKIWVRGEWLPQEFAEQEQIRFEKDEMTMIELRGPLQRYEVKYKFKLNEDANPKQIDIHMSPKFTVRGIFHLENDTLYLSLNWRKNDAPRPKLFVPDDGLAGKIYKLARQK